LAPAPKGAKQAITFDPSRWRGQFIARQADDGVHALLRGVGADHHIWMPAALAYGQTVACVVLLDGDTLCGAAAALQFWRDVVGARAAPERHSDQRWGRMGQSLRAYDGHLAGGSYRAIAEEIFGAPRVAAESWRTSSLRDATIRLVRSGAALVSGDYKRLLRHRTDE
jgi:hypothetical protein